MARLLIGPQLKLHGFLLLAVLAGAAFGVTDSGSNNPSARCEELIRTAKREMRISDSVSKRLLAHPKLGPVFRSTLEAYRWLSTSEAKEVFKATALRINEKELATSRQWLAEHWNRFRPDQVLAELDADREASEDSPPASPQEIHGWRRGVERLMGELRQFASGRQEGITKWIMAQVNPLGEYEAAARAYAENHPGEPTLALDLASLLMEDYMMVGLDQIDYFRLQYFLILRYGSDKAATIARTEAVFNAMLEAVGGSMESMARFINKLGPPILAAGYKLRKPAHIPFQTVCSSVSRKIREQIAPRFMNAVDFEQEFKAILDEALNPIQLSTQDAQKMRLMVETSVRREFQGYFPSLHKALTGEALISQCEDRLTFKAKNLVKALTREESAEATRRTSAAGAAAPVSVPVPSRLERIRRYQENKSAREAEQVLENPERSERAASAASAKEDKANKPAIAALTEEELERVISERSISDQRAETILNFYERLGENEKSRFRLAMGQLLDRSVRRLHNVSEGSISGLTDTDIYELRLQGSDCNRVYFGIHPHQGPMLIGAHLKKSLNDQMTHVKASNTAWRRYVDAK